MTSPCEECRNLSTDECLFCSYPKFSRFVQRDSAALVVIIAATVLIAAIAVVVMWL